MLYIAAHPDDENTQVIAYLARGRGYRTAYLSLTRGDGGQNLLGPQFREQLGVARTQELLVARRLDGGRQYFTRAKDFGYSKDYQETLRIWDREAVLADIVRVIRAFRPDVIVTRFSPEPGPTHGHHTASVVLAVEAFKLAGDPQAFPEQLGELTPWQPRRIFHNVGLGGAGAGAGRRQRERRVEDRGRRQRSGIGRIVCLDRRPQPRHAQDAGIRRGPSRGGRGLEDRDAFGCSGASPPRGISSTEWTRRGAACRVAPRSRA